MNVSPMTMSEWGCSCGSHFRQMATTLRCLLEVCAALSVLSWSTARLPNALHLSGFFIRRLTSLVVSTPFVFFVGNAIIVTLFVANTKTTGKSADTCGKKGTPTTSSVKAHEHEGHARQLQQKQGLLRLEEGIQTEHQQKTAYQQQDRCSSDPVDDTYYEDKAVCWVEKSSSVHTYRRTRSDRFSLVSDFSKPQAQLRRSVTDVSASATKEKLLSIPTKKRARGQGRRPDTSIASRYYHYKDRMDVEPAEEGQVGDEEPSLLSDEELRRRVEAFIAKQLKFHREEEMSMSISS